MARVFSWTSSTISSSNSSPGELPIAEIIEETTMGPSRVASSIGDMCDQHWLCPARVWPSPVPSCLESSTSLWLFTSSSSPSTKQSQFEWLWMRGGPRTGRPVLNLDTISIMNFKSESQLQHFTVDCVKKASQDLCWNCFRMAIRKRDLKMWIQALPPDTPLFPCGRFEPLDFDSTWREVLNIHQIPLAVEHLHLRAHHPEGLFD